jgi:hypothetical protein
MIQLWVLKNWCKNTFLLQKKKAFSSIIFLLNFSGLFWGFVTQY